jgi:dihydrofolate synthase/folylpolyglutamate synthase
VGAVVTEAQHYGQELRRIEAEIFGRRGEGHVHPTNERMQALIDLLGDPQKNYRAIHLTGTNGKTSTARMIDELVRGFGLRSGRYTSPHLSSVTERIVIDGAPVSDRTFVEGYRELEAYIALVDARNEVPLSFFEIVTAMAFSIFADAPVDVAVVEVGLGGTWDNTNVIDGEVAVVTPIGLDHMQYLGDTVVRIAGEKAGIIKPEAVAILAAQPPEAAAELLRRATEVEAAVAREGLEFGVIERRIAVGGQFLTLQGLGGVYDEIFLPLHGAHQAQNAACALAAVEAFFGAGAQGGALDVETVRRCPLTRTARAHSLRTDDPARRRAQPRGHEGQPRSRRRGFPVPPVGRGLRRDGGQGRDRHARTARTGRGRPGDHAELRSARAAGGRTGRRGDADLRA